MKEKKFSFVATLWWCLGLLLLGSFLMVFAPRESRASYTENRMLSGFPAFTAENVLSGTFMSGMESFLSDGFFRRDDVIALSDSLVGCLDCRTEEDRLLMDDTEKQLTELTGVYEDETEEAETYDDEIGPYDEGASLGTIRSFVKRTPSVGRALASATPLLGGTSSISVEPTVSPTPASADNAEAPYTLSVIKKDGSSTRVYSYSEKNMRTFAETLNLWRSHLPEDGAVFFAQIPISSTSQRLTLQRKVYSGWQSNMESGLQAMVGDGVHIYNAPEILAPAIEDREDVYFSMDHHWTPLGAYYVCAKMIADQGYPVLSYDEYTYEIIKSKPNRDGSRDRLDVLHPLLPARSLIVTHLTEEEEIPLMNYEGRTYVVYMNNTRTPWRRVVTGFRTGRNALVVCDSFGNAFTPFLLPYYDEVHMVDPRKGYYSKAEAGGNIGELIRAFGINDVYIILSTTNGVNSKNGLDYLRRYLIE